jgi:hypothetical protein
MEVEGRLEARLARVEQRLEGRLGRIEARLDALRSDLIRVALATHDHDWRSPIGRQDDDSE